MKEANESKGGAIGAIIGTVVLALACVVAGWIASGIYAKHALARAAAKMAAMARPNVASVAVTNAEMRVYNLPERFVAHAEAVQEVELLPQVDGYIKEIKFKEGDIVKAGQILYVLDDERYQAVANQCKADLEAANADLEAAKAETRRAERYWSRMQSVDERGITQKERDDAQADAEKSKASEERAKAAVVQAKANLVVAEYDVKRTKVFAPITGQIGKNEADIGDYVAPSKGTLAKIVQVDPIRVSFPITDRAFVDWRMAVKNGKDTAYRMRIILPNGAEYDKTGTLDFDDNEMSKETATVMLRLSFPNPDRLLIPNSYVTVLQDFVTPPKHVAVPQQCLIELSGGNQGVWIVKDDMTVEQRPVTVKEAFEGWTPIVKGLSEGERVVLSGVGKLASGMKVTLATPTGNDDIVKNYKAPIEN